MKPKQQPGRRGFVSLRRERLVGRYGTLRSSLFPRSAAVVLAMLLSTGLKLAAQSTPIYPTWWANQGLLSGTSPNDYAAANQGQAKNMAVGAVNELDADLAQFGGAGAALIALSDTLTLSDTSSQTEDYAAVNLGQLKALAQPFYDRLLSIGYTLGPLTSGTYPWHGLTPNDYAVANLGQLKYLFSFDVTYSSSGDGIPDWWANKYFPGQAISPGASISGSGGTITYLQAFQQGLNLFDGQTPAVTVVSGNYQTGPVGGFLPAPLVIGVADASGKPIVNAPVYFSVAPAYAQLQRSYMATPNYAAQVLTDQDGHASVYLQLGSIPNNTFYVRTFVQYGYNFAKGDVWESSDNGNGGPYRSPFSPSNVVGTINADGSEDMTWQNNTDSPALIPIWHWDAGPQSWRQIDSVPATTTSYHVPPNP
jgi:hypothetical protein